MYNAHYTNNNGFVRMFYNYNNYMFTIIDVIIILIIEVRDNVLCLLKNKKRIHRFSIVGPETREPQATNCQII